MVRKIVATLPSQIRRSSAPAKNLARIAKKQFATALIPQPAKSSCNDTGKLD